jgi:hypothetical protein
MVDDLDKFFAALRQVVHDARTQVALDEPEADGVVLSTHAGPTPDAPERSDMPSASATELAPSTAELMASLEADRDLWRERAVVWRERAMGADILVKALNAHMSDLQINLEDLRLAMRVLGNEGVAPPEARAELSSPDLTSLARSVEREVEAGPQE